MSRFRFLKRGSSICVLIALAVTALWLTLAAAGEQASSSTVAIPEAPAVVFRDKLYDVAFLSDTEVWAVGYPGLLLHSTDGGGSWTRKNGLTEQALFAVDFINAKTGWVAGRSGTLLSTVDGGANWKVHKPLCDEPLFDVDFVDDKHGWAVGNFGRIVKTVDGGETWDTTVLEPMANAGINSVQFISETEGWIAGEYPLWDADLEEGVTAETLSNLFHTIDGGQTWQIVKTGLNYALYDVYFTDSQHGWIIGSKGNLLLTADGGATWKSIPTETKSHLVSMVPVNDALWVVGTEGTLLKVIGEQVEHIQSHAFTWLNGVAFTASGRGVVVGGRGTLMVTEDGGKNWKTFPIKH